MATDALVSTAQQAAQNFVSALEVALTAAQTTVTNLQASLEAAKTAAAAVNGGASATPPQGNVT